MITTEKEMKGKWCPKFQTGGYAKPYEEEKTNRDNTTFSKKPYCLGSECAMWEPLINDCGLKTTAQEKLLHLLTDDGIRKALQKDLKDAYYKRADS